MAAIKIITATAINLINTDGAKITVNIDTIKVTIKITGYEVSRRSKKLIPTSCLCYSLMPISSAIFTILL